MIVCGNGGSGKTSCIENLIEALNEHAASKQLEGSSKTRLHKLERINVLAVSNIDLMFGYLKSSGDWADGVFTSIWKRSNKSHSVTATTTWLCFDAPVQDVWCRNLKSVLDQGKVRVYICMGRDTRSKRSPLTNTMCLSIVCKTCLLISFYRTLYLSCQHRNSCCLGYRHVIYPCHVGFTQISFVTLFSTVNIAKYNIQYYLIYLHST